MTEIEQIVDFILTTLGDFVLIGFGVFSVVQIILSISKKYTWWSVDMTAVQIVRIFGLLFIMAFLYDTYIKLYGIRFEQDSFPFTHVITNEYWYTYWLKPIIVILSTCILWFKRIRELKTLRTLSAVLLIIPYDILTRFIITHVSDRLDYLPSAWTYYTPITSYVLGYLIYGIGFGVMTIVVHYSKLKIVR